MVPGLMRLLSHGELLFNVVLFFTALRWGWVLRHLARGLVQTQRVGTISSSQLRWHSGWTLALERRYLLPLDLLPWYSPRAMVLSIVPESALVRVQVPYIPYLL
jgi:hypothetical protein